MNACMTELLVGGQELGHLMPKCPKNQ